uniref:B30.2/SPRY domain-containing protein n=1 Tax=Oncorhynchus tshawytscha TaxID=74940 RepID=A0AAZ3Q0B3_ONCTS
MGHEVHIGVTYSGIGREGRGHDCGLGYNNKSWTLSCNNDIYTARYNKKPTTVPDHAFRSHRIGVYLDWPAGTLSFYSVSSDTMTHLHTFTSTFTEPLYPAFRIWYCGASLSLCQVPLSQVPLSQVPLSQVPLSQVSLCPSEYKESI